MGDAGEGLVDTQSRLQELIEERDAARRAKAGARLGSAQDPERERQLRSLTMAEAELRRQQASTQNPIRLDQIRLALADIQKRLAAL
jgi:hypothetical protein